MGLWEKLKNLYKPAFLTGVFVSGCVSLNPEEMKRNIYDKVKPKRDYELLQVYAEDTKTDNPRLSRQEIEVMEKSVRKTASRMGKAAIESIDEVKFLKRSIKENLNYHLSIDSEEGFRREEDIAEEKLTSRKPKLKTGAKLKFSLNQPERILQSDLYLNIYNLGLFNQIHARANSSRVKLGIDKLLLGEGNLWLSMGLEHGFKENSPRPYVALSSGDDGTYIEAFYENTRTEEGNRHTAGINIGISF